MWLDWSMQPIIPREDLAALQSPYVAWGLAGILVLVLVLLAYLRSRKRIGERVAILIIVITFLLALLALTVNIE